MLDKSHKNLSCSTCSARKDSIFGNYCECDATDVDDLKSSAYYKKNQPVFLEGSFPRGVYCLNQGKVKIFARGDEGKEQIIHIAKEGEIIGFRSMFSEEPFKVSASTLEECNICFINKEDFLNMIDTNMAQKSVRERLAFSLIILADIYGEEQINLTREDMANFIGTATETLIRLLKDFKEEGILEIHTRKLEITNKEKLFQIAGK